MTTLQIYGAGRTGLAVARLAAARGVAVTGVWNRSVLPAARAALARGLPLVVGGAPPPAAADVWLVSVSDDAIGEVAEGLAAGLAQVASPGGAGEGGALRPRAVAHCAGARPTADLAPLQRAGIPCGTWHPAMTFRGADSDASALGGARAAIEGDDAARPALEALSEALGVAWHALAAPAKPRYHSALVLASNGRVALDACARRLLADAGLDRETARAVLAPLVARTEENLREADPALALTGPVARGDVETVRGTLAALSDRPEIARLYRALAGAALALVPQESRGEGHRAVAALIGTEDSPSW